MNSCTLLKDLNIYTIKHDKEAIEYLEIYYSDFKRLILIPLGSNYTLLSIDLYPCPFNTIENSRIKTISLKEAVLGVVELPLQNSHKLKQFSKRSELTYICTESRGLKKCEIINLKLYLGLSVEDILNGICVEDIRSLLSSFEKCISIN